MNRPAIRRDLTVATLPSALPVSSYTLGASWVFLDSAGAATCSAASLLIPVGIGVAKPAIQDLKRSLTSTELRIRSLRREAMVSVRKDDELRQRYGLLATSQCKI